MKKLILFFCVASLLGTTAIAGAALFQNGSFEDPGASSGVLTLFAGNTTITAWTVGSGSIDYLGPPIPAADGVSSIDMNGVGPGSISQIFTPDPGNYEVIFAMTANPGDPNQIKGLTASAAGFSGNFIFNPAEDTGWVNFSFPFLATGETTLTFSSLESGLYGALLDNVRVNLANGGGAPVPEPASLLLLGAGLTGLAFFGRKRFVN